MRAATSTLRIALVAPSEFPIRQPFAGGLESVVWQLARTLRARGHEVALFASEGSDGVDDDYAFPVSPWSPSRTAARDVSMPGYGFMRDHHAYLRLLMALSGPLSHRFDVVHNHALHHLPVAMTPLVPLPVLTTLHTPPTPWLESAITLAAEQGSHGRFAAVSRFAAKQWRVLPQSALPTVVHNGVDLHVWRPGPGGGGLAWSGRIVPEKAPHLAIAAARRAGMPLTLAGPVGDVRYFDEQVRPLLGRGVTYAGHLPTDQLADLLGGVTAVLVTPEWDEPYGLVVAEALACGTPVVAFARGGVPEIVGGGPVGALVPRGDVEAMAVAAREVATLDRLPVRSYAEAHLSIERMVSRYERLYAQLRSDATWEVDRTA